MWVSTFYDIQNGPFFGPYVEGEPFDVELNKNNMQTISPIGPFLPILRSLH